MDLSPEELGLALAEDAAGRLITRLSQLLPAHIDVAEFEFSPGPSTAELGPTASGEFTLTDTNILEEHLISTPDPIASAAWTATGLWHVTEYRSSTQFKSFNYGQNDVGRLGDVGSVPPDYNAGTTTGTLTSPVITGTGTATQVVLRFRFFTDVESGLVKDLISVNVKSSPGNLLLSNYDKAGMGMTSGSTGGTFVTFESDITGDVVGAGNFYLEFVFDSVDSGSNSTEGWYIDDVEVMSIEP